MKINFDNSAAIYKGPKTAHPGGIQTRDLLLWWLMQ
jgi:hypothetical protein